MKSEHYIQHYIEQEKAIAPSPDLIQRMLVLPQEQTKTSVMLRNQLFGWSIAVAASMLVGIFLGNKLVANDELILVNDNLIENFTALTTYGYE